MARDTCVNCGNPHDDPWPECVACKLVRLTDEAEAERELGAARIATLERQLTEERQRREALEDELARLMESNAIRHEFACPAIAWRGECSCRVTRAQNVLDDGGREWRGITGTASDDILSHTLRAQCGPDSGADYAVKYREERQRRERLEDAVDVVIGIAEVWRDYGGEHGDRYRRIHEQLSAAQEDGDRE